MIFGFLLTTFAAPLDDIVRPDVLPAWASESGSASNDGEWWVTFKDPALQKIMEAALDSNRNVAAAFQRAKAARAQGQGSVSALLPNLSFNSNAQLSPTASRGFQFGGFGEIPGAPEPPKTYWTGQAAFQMNWEVDVFLRNQQTVAASHHDALAAEGDRDATVLAFATQVAEGYFDVVASRERLRLVESQASSSASLLEIVELRYQAGDVRSVDVLQQRQAAAGAQARLPLARANVLALEQQLAVALSLPPATVVPGIATTLPELPPLPDAGVPGDLILNRPDLRAAEERIGSATSRRRNAVRQLLPTVALSASAGWQFFNETEFTNQSFWNAGGSLNIPLFAGGRIQSGIRGARANEHAAVHTYTQLAANAVLEVENALLQEHHRTLHKAAVQEQLAAATAALDEARAQYVLGIGSYLILLNAQNTREATQLALIDSHRALLSSRIQLHDALGGTWINQTSKRLGGIQ